MSGGNANTTISFPGPHWRMLWGNGGLKNFQLDIVGFLAILGENSVIANAQVSALSRLFYLPRLLPAPQAFLPPSRVTELKSAPAWVTSVQTGNHKPHVHHIANILLNAELEKHEVRCVEVTKEPSSTKTTSWTDTIFRGVDSDARKKSDQYTPVKAKATGPLTFVTLTGFLLSISLFLLSIIFGDGYSLVATLLLSFLSTLIGVANKWTLNLTTTRTNQAPQSDTVIRYPNGSFLVVLCTDDIARELFFAPEEIKYNIKRLEVYRLISLLGSLLLMLGIIFLANAKLQLQFAWAGAYGIINAAHWLAAAVPPKQHWDLSCYTVKEHGVGNGPKSKSFTEALWKAILITQKVEWVKNGEAAPKTEAWNWWIQEAEERAKRRKCEIGDLDDPNPEWNNGNKEPLKTTMYTEPDDGWDPKEAWEKINSQQTKDDPSNKCGYGAA